jgi:predicted SAM-dependent methyltransferase
VKAFLLDRMRDPRFAGLKKFGFFMRGLLFLGRKYRCPCCGWYLRSFVERSSILKKSATGFCPRCNAKARHRRNWLYLEQHTKLFLESTRLLEVAPWWALSRRFGKMANIEFTGLDLERTGPQVTTVGDVTCLPMESGHFDAVICIHVLEHVEKDRQAISEMHRVLKPGGWAIISVPIRLNQPTHEDPGITDPEERARVFGERGHVRFYGKDFIERLESAGFQVTLDQAEQIPKHIRQKYGLRDDENIFHCYKTDRGSSAGE